MTQNALNGFPAMCKGRVAEWERVLCQRESIAVAPNQLQKRQ
jgi:hypothetical protein